MYSVKAFKGLFKANCGTKTEHMKQLIIAVLISVILVSCTKNHEEIFTEQCAPACLLSEKYTKDTVYIRTDTLWEDSKVCGKELDIIKKEIEKGQKLVVLCADLSIEHWYYVIGK